MKFHELSVTSNKASRRVGRGIASGQGKTAGRGTKGQKSRAGSGRRPGFEGGQNPMLQRLPKLRGFHSHKPAVETVYTGQLDAIGTQINNKVLAEAGVVTSPYAVVKLITKGEVAKKHTVSLQIASEGAIAAVQKAGGTFTAVSRQPRTKAKAAKESAEK